MRKVIWKNLENSSLGGLQQFWTGRQRRMWLATIGYTR